MFVQPVVGNSAYTDSKFYFILLVSSREKRIATYKVDALDHDALVHSSCEVVNILWDKKKFILLVYAYIGRKFCELPYHSMSLIYKEKFTVVLCTGLRKNRIKLKEDSDKAALIATSLSCPKIENWDLRIKCLHVIPEKLRVLGSVTLNTHGPVFIFYSAWERGCLVFLH